MSCLARQHIWGITCVNNALYLGNPLGFETINIPFSLILLSAGQIEQMGYHSRQFLGFKGILIISWLLLQRSIMNLFLMISIVTLTPRKIQRYILLPAVIPTCQRQKKHTIKTPRGLNGCYASRGYKQHQLRVVTGVWVPLTCLSSVNSGSDGRGCWPPCWQGRSSSQHRNSRNLSRCLSADAPPVWLHLWDDFLVNNILVLVRFYIHKSKYFKAKPSFYVFHNELISYTLSFLNYLLLLIFYFLLHLILLLCKEYYFKWCLANFEALLRVIC